MDLEYNIVEEKRVNGNAVVKVIGVGGGHVILEFIV